MDIEQARFNMIEQQIRPWGVLNSNILDVLKTIKRENFVPQKYRNLAFADLEIPLSNGQKMLSPKIDARVLQELMISKNENILEIGTGSGYMAALLASCGKQVTTVEIDYDLYNQAKNNLQCNDIQNVSVIHHNGLNYLTEKDTFDIIVLSGGLPFIPQSILENLKIGGRLSAFVGSEPIMKAQIVTRKENNKFEFVDLFETFVEYFNEIKFNSSFVF